MISAALLLLLGLVILLTAGESLVRGAASLAKLANIPPLVIGLTIVAFGTSAPELVVTVRAVLGGAAGIAIGNIVGSNVANILLVLGLPAIIAPIAMTVPRLRRQGVALLLATGIFTFMVYRDGMIAQTEALLFTACMVGYFAFMLLEARSGSADLQHEAEELVSDKVRLLPTLGLTAIGLIGLPIGATLLVANGEHLAKMIGVRDEVIGLTVVAFGTSLPELATVLAAALRKEVGVSVGTIIGSNIFNMLFVGSAAGYAGVSRFTEDALNLDMPVMIAATLFICAMIFLRHNLGRITGVLSLAAYLFYIITLGATGAA